jgi:aminoglycoside phosphotransferase (APT) family kinase protein
MQSLVQEFPLTQWLVRELGFAPPVRFDRIAGGRSNLTFFVTDASGRTAVLRRPPLDGVLATAHDVVREARIIGALAGTAVPVPEVFGVCDEPASGGPFFVMERVDGLVLRTTADALGAPAAARAGAGEALVDALAALHACDVVAIGLGDLVRRSGYLERQLRRWRAQLEHAVEPPPLLFEVHDALVDAIPPAGPQVLTHGDFRIDNCILGPDGSVRAVLDWELASVGDPIADLALLLVYWREAGDPMLDESYVGAPTAVPGFALRRDLLARYETRTGAVVEHLPVYLAFAAWRLACILQGVVDRHASGAMGEVDSWVGMPASLVASHAAAAAGFLATFRP